MSKILARVSVLGSRFLPNNSARPNCFKHVNTGSTLPVLFYSKKVKDEWPAFHEVKLLLVSRVCSVSTTFNRMECSFQRQ